MVNAERRAYPVRLWAVLAVAIMALSAVVLAAAPETRVFDPRPLMAALDEKAKGQDFTFAVFGDTYAEETLAGLMKLADAQGADFSVTVGDLVSVGGGPRGAADWKKLAEIAGPYLRKRPTWPVPGNHELNVIETDPAARRQARQETYDNFKRFYNIPLDPYSFTFGRSKFIVLDWDLEMDVDPPTQLAFLKAELAGRDNWDHVFVFRHMPFFAIGEKGPEEVPNRATEITHLLTANRVDAVFSGHEHLYYRARFDGVSYIQAGSGGGLRTLARLAEVLPGSSWMGVVGNEYVVHVPGKPDLRSPYVGDQSDGPFRFVVFITVKGKAVTGKVVSVGGSVWEQFTIEPPAAPLAPAAPPEVEDPVGAAAD
jgi:hypothetical protein